MAALSEEEEFEFRLRMEQEQGGSGAVEGPSKLDKIKMGLGDQIYGIEQILDKVSPDAVKDAVVGADEFLYENTGGYLGNQRGRKGIDQRIQEREAEYQKKRGPDAGFDGYRTIGNVANPINYIPFLGPASKAPAVTGLLGRIFGQGTAGGVLAATNPVVEGDFWEGKRNQAGTGFLAGGAVPVVTGGFSRLVSPNSTRNADLNLLKKEGVKPTVGQTLGGAWNKAEEKMTTMPIMGDFIHNARVRSQKDFNEAAINRASGPLAVNVKGVGHDAINAADEAVNAAYDKALDKIKSVNFDKQFSDELAVLKNGTSKLHPDNRNTFNLELRDLVESKMKGGMTGKSFKEVDSELKKLADDWISGNSTASERKLGKEFIKLRKILKNQVRRIDPDSMADVDLADKAYANLSRVNKAAQAAKGSDGVFTPYQLINAAAVKDKSVGKNAVGKGKALLQDLGRAGQNVIGNKVPNSFSADRALYAGGGLATGLYNPMIPAGLLAGSAAYTAPGQSLLRGLVNSRPDMAQPIGQAIRKFSPLTVPAAAQSANEEMDNLFNRRR